MTLDVYEGNLAWLREVEHRLHDGRPIRSTDILVALHGHLPLGFNLDSLNRDFFYNDIPSLKGLKAIGDPNALLPDVEKAIFYIKDRILSDERPTWISPDEIATALGITVERAERVLLLVGSIGRFSTGGSMTPRGYSRMELGEDGNVVAEYLSFHSLEEHLLRKEDEHRRWRELLAGSPQPTKESPVNDRTLRPHARIFLSHAAADHGIARLTKLELEKRIPGMKVFLTSFPGMIPSGDDWLAHIKEALERAEGYVILLTPTSVERPWVLFETGAAWMSKRPWVTVSAGSLDRAKVAHPLGSFQILSLEIPEEAEAVFQQLGAKEADAITFSASIIDAQHASGQAEWSGVVVDGRYFAWEGPTLHDLTERNPTPPPAALTEVLRTTGWIPRYGTRAKVNHHIARGQLVVWETNRSDWRREILCPGDGDQILLIGRDSA